MGFRGLKAQGFKLKEVRASDLGSLLGAVHRFAALLLVGGFHFCKVPGISRYFASIPLLTRSSGRGQFNFD